MTHWTSIDIGAGKSGIAYWEGSTLLNSFVIKPCGGKGFYWFGGTKVTSKYEAWFVALSGQSAVVVERGAGHRPNVINGQAKLRGYIEAITDIPGFASRGMDYFEVNVAEWRRVIKEDQGISWPKESARQKALAIQLVKKLYGKDVTEDEADAILLGRAAQRMGLSSEINLK
jgi:hypothetical protein